MFLSKQKEDNNKPWNHNKSIWWGREPSYKGILSLYYDTGVFVKSLLNILNRLETGDIYDNLIDSLVDVEETFLGYFPLILKWMLQNF